MKKFLIKLITEPDYIKRLVFWYIFGKRSHGHKAEFTVMLGVTYSCQFNCAHCGVKGYEKNGCREFSTEELVETINNLPPKTKFIVFTGGEPLLQKDLPKLISVAKNKKLGTFLNTNGYLLTKEITKNLKQAGLDAIEISIDNANPQIHDSLRKHQNAFENALSGIKNCLLEKIPCSINTYATKENIKNGELEKIILLGKELGVNFVKILSPILSGKWLKNDELKLNENERKRLKKILRFDFAFLEDDDCYSVRKKMIYISPYGDIQPCCYIPIIFGNLKESSIEEIVKKMWDHPMYRMKTKECIMNNEEFRKKYIINTKYKEFLISDK
jgi:MoaA/NifB/PqqE/SkfB family radical SAM enzyme